MYENSGKFGFKCIWKVFNHSKVEFLLFEKAKEITFGENFRADKEIKDFVPKWENWIMKQNLKAKTYPKK